MPDLTLRAAVAACLCAWTLGAAAADRSAHPQVAAASPPPGATTAPAVGAASLGPAGEGRRLYLKLNCYGCHGMAAAGGMGPRIVRAEMGDLSEVMLQGEDGGMRSYRGYVTTTDIQNLWAYLQSIGTASEPKFRDWWVAVPTK